MPPPPSRLAAAIIDLDGTLVDTLADFHAALCEMLASLQRPPLDVQVVARFIGKGSEHLIRSALAHAGAPAALFGPAWDAYQQAYARVNGRHSMLYAGAADGVHALRAAGLRLACLTNKPTEFARELLVQKGLAQAFDGIWGGDAFERRKPDPLPILRVCDALGVAPASAVVIGDSSNDALAARAAGAPVLLVTYGYNHGQPVRTVDADGYLDSLADAPLALAGRFPPHA